VKDGEDMNSTYDEANPYDTKGEYDADRSIETDADSLGMHIDSGKIVELTRAMPLWHTPPRMTAMTWTKKVILKMIHQKNSCFYHREHVDKIHRERRDSLQNDKSLCSLR
jgi:hypothetical protein